MGAITINPDRPTGRVDRRILGGFTEHLGRCIYGGIFDEGSPLATERGFRKDVIEAVRALRPPVLRWPGGNFASGYHWTDGIGPAGHRPRRMALAWHGEEPNVEWNVWYREMDGARGLEERYDLGDALAVACYVHAFVRHAGIVKMANLAQLVNVIAPIVTGPDGLFLQSIYHPLRLFADHLGEVALDLAVECDKHEFIPSGKPGRWPHRFADRGPFPVLDAVATWSEAERTLMLSVINRSPDEEVAAEIRLGGSLPASRVLLEELNAADWHAVNSFDRPDAVSVTATAMDVPRGSWLHRFPAHSLTVFTLGESPRPVR